MEELPLSRIRPARSGDLTFDLVQRQVTVFQVVEQELDDFAVGGSSLNWTFFGVSVGAAIGFGTAVLTAPLDGMKLMVFVGFASAFTILTLYFLAMGIRDTLRAKKRVKQIKQRVPSPVA